MVSASRRYAASRSHGAEPCFSTTVRAIRDSLREAVQVCSTSFRIIGSISVSKTSRSKVSSAEMDCVGLSGTTSLLSMPRANS